MSFPLDKRIWIPVSSIPRDELTDLHLSGEDLPSVNLMRVAHDSTTTKNEDMTDGKRCSVCNLVFETLEEQRNHFKTDLHRYNLKRASSGLRVLTQTELDALAEDDVGSISASESASSEDVSEDEANGPAATKLSNVVSFRTSTHSFSMLTNVLTASKLREEGDSARLVEGFQNLCWTTLKPPPQSPVTWAVILLRSGHFAAAIFKQGQVTHHKTFHRYTVRKKAGGSQSAHDGGGKGKAKSAGATLRRYNEQALALEIHTLLTVEWRGALAACGLVFLSCGAATRPMFFKPPAGAGGRALPSLQRGDMRLRTVPFPTARPTLNEAKRVVARLALVEVCPLPLLQAEESQAQAGAGAGAGGGAGAGAESPLKRGGGGGRGKSKDRGKSKECGGGEESELTPAPAPVMTPLYLAAGEGDVEAVTSLLRQLELEREREQEQDREQEGGQGRGQGEGREQGDGYILPPPPSPLVSPPIPTTAAAAATGTDTGATETVPPVSMEAGASEEAGVTMTVDTPCGPEGGTALHAAAAGGHGVVLRLLLGAGADPTRMDLRHRTPYLVCADKGVRTVFREYMGMHPEQWDYTAAHVPGALTEDMKQDKKAKEREKKKRQRAKKKAENNEAAKIAKAAAAAAAAEAERVAAEAAAADQGDKCDSCGKGMLRDEVPFYRLDFKYCGAACVQSHKRVLTLSLAMYRWRYIKKKKRTKIQNKSIKPN